MIEPERDPFDLPWPVYRPPSRWARALGWLSWRVRVWYCGQFGHDARSGVGFNGEYTQHWWECRRCGECESD